MPIERNEWNRLLTDDEVVLGGRRRFETVHGIIRPVVHVRSDQEQENGRNVQRIEPPEELHDELWTERQIDRAREKETERQTERERERERERRTDREGQPRVACASFNRFLRGSAAAPTVHKTGFGSFMTLVYLDSRPRTPRSNTHLITKASPPERKIKTKKREKNPRALT